MNKRRIGEKYEQIAATFLEKKGYVILEFNFRCRFGEIDIIAKDRCDLVFIEVKYRSNLNYGSPYEAVDYKKQHTIKKMAKYYMSEHNLKENTYIRFDVVGIIGENISVIKNAFGGI